MTKIKERRKVILLRKEGKAFSEIRRIVKVSKSTLSIWLEPYPLSNGQMQKINKMRYRAIEKFRETMKIKRKNRLEKYLKEIKQKILPFSKKEFLIAGLLLYWGEGNKANFHTISINNTDPSVLKFTKYWYLHALDIKEKNIKIYLHLYRDMNIIKEINYWSNQLCIPKKQFIKPYIKESKKSSIDQKGFGHGTCALVVHNTVIKEKILMGIQGVADYYSKKIDSF